MNPIDEVIQTPNEATHRRFDDDLYLVDNGCAYYWNVDLKAWEPCRSSHDLDIWLAELTPNDLSCPKCGNHVEFHGSRNAKPRVKCKNCQFVIFKDGQDRNNPNTFDSISPMCV